MVLRARQHPLAKSIAFIILLGAAAASTASETRTGSGMAVTNCNDNGPGSLRAAIAAASDGDVIDLNRLACSTISLTTGAFDIGAAGLALAGPGADRLVIDAGRRSRIIDGAPVRDELVVRGITLRNGKAEGDGGCIDVAGALTLNDVVVEGCEARASELVRGGGVHAGMLMFDHSRISASTASSETGDARGGGAYVDGGATIRFSTLSGNTARSAGSAPYKGMGGGLMVEGTSAVVGSTIEGNAADFGGGAVLQQGSSNDFFDVFESTVSGNSATKTGGILVKGATTFRGSTIAFNCAMTTQAGKYVSGIGLNSPTASTMSASGTLISDNGLCAGAQAGNAYDVGGFGASLSGSHNLIRSVPTAFLVPTDTLRTDPRLLPLADNGGPTRTHALGAGSPAIGAGKDDANVSFDQRGNGPWIAGAMSDPLGSGPRDPRSAAWKARIVGAHSDIGAYEVQSVETVRTVTHCGDNGDGSFRSAAEAAVSGDRIDLRALSCPTIYLKTDVKVTAGNLDIVGPGADRLAIKLDDPVNRPHRLITHTGAGTLSLAGLAFADGADIPTDGSDARGGCIDSQSFVRGRDLIFKQCRAISGNGNCSGGAVDAVGAQFEATWFDGASCESMTRLGTGGAIHSSLLSLIDSHVSQGTAIGNFSRRQASTELDGGEGGCIRGDARARLERSTLDRCEAGFGAAGMFASLDLVDSTVSGNHAISAVAGLYAEDASVANSTIAVNLHSGADFEFADGLYTLRWAHVDSTILYGNGGSQGDLGGGAVTGAHNLIGSASVEVPSDTLTADPRLAPLADNGGHVPTMALAAGSAASDHGSNPLNLATDARGEGFARVGAVAADIGAYEVQAPNTDLVFANGFDP